jgi:benzoate-CoA ligase
MTIPITFNAADHLLDRHVREGRGGRTAVIAANGSLTYAELTAATHRVAAGLRELGVRPEERVVLCMVDGIELLTGILGAMYAGAVPVPVSTMVTGPELGALLADARARVLCVSAEFLTQAKAALEVATEVTDVVLDRVDEHTLPVTSHGWDVLSGAEPLDLPYPTREDSAALWLYTSGTTGRPKAAMHRHASIREVCECYAEGVLGVTAEDRCYSVPKLFFAYGIGNSAFFPLAAGGTSILEAARPTPQIVADRVRADRPTLFFGVPTFYAALLASDLPDDTFAGVRQAVSAGEPLPAALF